MNSSIFLSLKLYYYVTLIQYDCCSYRLDTQKNAYRCNDVMPHTYMKNSMRSLEPWYEDKPRSYQKVSKKHGANSFYPNNPINT